MERSRGFFWAMSMVSVVASCAGGTGDAPPHGPSPAATTPSTVTTTASVDTATTSAVVTGSQATTLLELQQAAIGNILAAFNAHDAQKLASFYTFRAVTGVPGRSGWSEEQGNGAVAEGHTDLFASMKDMRWGSARAFAKGNVVIQEWVTQARKKGHAGNLTNVGIRGISVYWFDHNGLIAKDDTYFDAKTIAMQTGSMDGTPRPIPEVPKGAPQIVSAAGTASEDKLVEAANAMYKAFSGKDEKAYLAFLDKDAERRDYAEAEDKKGQKAFAEAYRTLHKAFSDLSLTVANAWAIGDVVIVESVMTGTHDGDLGAMKPTKRPVTLHNLDILTFGKDGKVTLFESYGNAVELLGELGVLDALKKP